MQTSVTDLFGIEHPIVSPGMSWISKPPLVAAVSEAGGLGILATGPLSEQDTRDSIAEVRKRTDRPFGVGVTLMMPGASENARVALEEQVPVINFQLGRGKWLIEGVHAYGGKAVATVTSVKHALSAERAGADGVLVTGHEAAAHGEEVTSMVLVPAVANAVRIPIIAAGGIADGRGLLAALALGAGGAAMGTRFAATAESALHENTKRTIVDKDVDETLYTNHFDGMWARLMRTPRSVEVTRKPMGFVTSGLRALSTARSMGMPIRPVLKRLIQNPQQARLLAYFGASLPLVEAATVEGDVENGVQFIGQAQGLVGDLPHAGDLVRSVVGEAEDLIETLSRRLTISSTPGEAG
jgi:enoyl-[acyl-carrier protein] reductase II